MAPVEVEEGGEHALAQLVVGLAVRPARAPRGVQLLRITGPHVLDRQSLPVADVDLSELIELVCVEAQFRRDDRCGLLRAPERARVHGAQTVAPQDGGELPRLAPPDVVWWGVRVPLQAALAVRVGLAVANEDERRRHAG